LLRECAPRHPGIGRGPCVSSKGEAIHVRAPQTVSENKSDTRGIKRGWYAIEAMLGAGMGGMDY